MKHFQKFLCALMVVILCFGMAPYGYALGPEPTDATETTPETTAPETIPETTAEDMAGDMTEAATEPPATEPVVEETVSSEMEEVLPEDDFLLNEDFALMSVGSTQGSIMLFDFADNGNYTTVLNSQVSCTYKPNGTGTTRTAYIKNLGWHFARYNGTAHPDEPLYCIEPWRSYGASTSGNSVDWDMTLDGSGSTSGSNVWYALPAERREAIGLILLYSDQMWNHSISVTTTSKANNPNVPLRTSHM